MLSEKTKEAVTNEVHRLFDLASEALNHFFPLPAVTFKRSGRNAGTAFLQQNRINFNRVLLHENMDAFYQDVIPHEVSHLIAYQYYGKVKPHGSEWQSIMRNIFGVAPSTTHQFDMTSMGIKGFTYYCGCGEVTLSVRRHNKAIKGVIYRCRRCGYDLQQQAKDRT